MHSRIHEVVFAWKNSGNGSLTIPYQIAILTLFRSVVRRVCVAAPFQEQRVQSGDVTPTELVIATSQDAAVILLKVTVSSFRFPCGCFQSVGVHASL